MFFGYGWKLRRLQKSVSEYNLLFTKLDLSPAIALSLSSRFDSEMNGVNSFFARHKNPIEDYKELRPSIEQFQKLARTIFAEPFLEDIPEKERKSIKNKVANILRRADELYSFLLNEYDNRYVAYDDDDDE